MRLENVKDVKPTKDGVLVDVHPLATEEDGIFIGTQESNPSDIKMYFGTVEKVGPDSTGELHCPGLKEGDIGFFSEFSGYHIATKEKSVKKLIPAYDIMAIIKDTKNLNEETIQPTSDRLLIEVKFVDQDSDGVVLSADDAKDPRLRDLDYGKALLLGPSTKGIVKKDQVVAYDPYAGEVVRRAAGINTPELRLIREDDILFVI
jgi:co-chaperonin GroES (HSP10)